MKFAFSDQKRLRNTTRKLIEQANGIIGEMQKLGYRLTLRQLYYQFVSRALLANKQSNYVMLGGAVDTGRKMGLIDWNAIEDRTRRLRSTPTFGSPQDFLATAASSWYATDLWQGSRVYCEFWVEKDALLGVVERPCDDFRIPYFACRGYASSSALFDAGRRLMLQRRAGKEVIVFHMGDHDPSGIDMTRNNEEMLRMYSQGDVTVKRIALNMDQVEQYDPPPNPAKETDSRFAQYADIYGEESWELDALDPGVLDRLIRENIRETMDLSIFAGHREQEAIHKAQFSRIADNWDDINSRMDDEGPEIEVEPLDEIDGLEAKDLDLGSE